MKFTALLIALLLTFPATSWAQFAPADGTGGEGADAGVITQPLEAEPVVVPPEPVVVPQEPVVSTSGDHSANAGIRATSATATTPHPEVKTPRARAVSNLRGDVLGGGWVAGALLYGGANAIVRTMRGQDAGDATVNALRDLGKPEFLVGSLAAGSAGAALGAAMPLPAIARAPMFLRVAASSATPLAFAAVASTLATNAIQLGRQGKLTPSALMKSVDWWGLLGQTAGSLAGMSLGATLVAAGLAPALAIGSVAIVPLVGGVVGAIAGAQLVHWLKTRKVKAEDGVNASTGAPTTGPDAPKANRGTGAGGRGGAGSTSSPGAGTAVPETLPIDVFGDLPRVSR
jgi:hypothetical protein